jgi:CHAT domain-containing protein/tetratricopeptide (TPR) repeat protein
MTMSNHIAGSLKLWTASLGALAMLAVSPAVVAQESESIALLNSFRVGTTGVLCTAQYRPTDAALQTMFDRGYQIVCRDATSAVGSLYALRTSNADDDASRLNGFLAANTDRLACGAREISEIEGLGGVSTIACTDKGATIDYRVYSLIRGNTAYIAEGLAGYDSVLRLGLASLVTDQPVPGAIEVATTSVSNPVAFARIQAGTLDAAAARNEAYNRNNYGAYAESSEFFETLASREGPNSTRTAEFIANQALQKANLGDFVEADALLARARQLVAASDGVTQRMIRNFQAITYLNQQQAQAGIAALDTPVSPVSDGLDTGDLADGLLTQAMADRINRENAGLRQLGSVDGSLTAQERGEILDGQALLLRGTALRMLGRYDEAVAVLDQGIAAIDAVRDGRISSTAWLRSDVRTERALIAESQGDFGVARTGFEEALAVLQRDYPQSPTLIGAKARLAAFLARRGESAASIALYDELVAEAELTSGASAMMKDILGPYFAQLADQSASDSAVDAKFFAASQLLQRPGVAQTQAVLARGLSEGDDEASALFRLSVARTREISRTAGEIAVLSEIPDPTPLQAQQLIDNQQSLENLQREQTVLQSRLGQYPRYRVLAPSQLTLADMQKLLADDEGYYKINLVGDAVYAQLITRNSAKSVQVTMSRQELDRTVAAIRDSIVVIENGQPVNYPFDVEKARALYLALFAGLEGDLKNIRHLVYEPDGALLQLPPALLIEEQEGVDAYLLKVEDITADPFDFTEITWFGRERRFSIAVSPRSFADVRTIAPSSGKQAYLGLGQNALPPERLIQSTARQDDNCEWPLATWGNPISPSELLLAQNVFGKQNATVLTQDEFTDQALLNRGDIDDYRILHFATHGLVTAPRPECPARPALVTSFGGEQSDGLLSFKEIFDLKLDADLVILSACDTAGQATVAASRDAGIETGGNFALDGLVRAFVGAGARSVLASHWPVPDDFNATADLISALFEAKPGQPINESLRLASVPQMDNALTSHPYYWAAFIVLGDGSKPLVR